MCKILEVEITQLCITSVFVVSGDFVFRAEGFLLFKWSYILKFLTDYSQLDFFLSQQRKNRPYKREHNFTVFLLSFLF